MILIKSNSLIMITVALVFSIALGCNSLPLSEDTSSLENMILAASSSAGHEDSSLDLSNLSEKDRDEIDEVHKTCLDLIKHNFWRSLDEIERKLCNEVILFKLNQNKMVRRRRFFTIQLGKNQKPGDGASQAQKGFKYGK